MYSVISNICDVPYCVGIIILHVVCSYMVVLFVSGQSMTALLYNHAVSSTRKQTKTFVASHKAARLIIRNLSFKVCSICFSREINV